MNNSFDTLLLYYISIYGSDEYIKKSYRKEPSYSKHICIHRKKQLYIYICIYIHATKTDQEPVKRRVHTNENIDIHDIYKDISQNQSGPLNIYIRVTFRFVDEFG
jgi:hypothetical protein